MKIPVSLGLKGIVTVQGVAPDGTIGHEQVIDNIICDEGLEELNVGGQSLAGHLLQHCIMGMGGSAAAVSDSFLGKYETYYYSFNCPSATCEEACAMVPQRTIRAKSSVSPDTFPDTFVFNDTDPLEPYWTMTRTREFMRNYTNLPVANPSLLRPPGTFCDAFWTTTWRGTGHNNLDVEAGYFKELSFCNHNPTPLRFQGSCFYYDEHGTRVDYDAWIAFWYGPLVGGIRKIPMLFNRVILPQSIGWQSSGGYWPSAPDVVLPTDWTIRVTFELRLYVDPALQTKVVDIKGTPTTVRTQVYRLDLQGAWKSFYENFGVWSNWENTAQVREDDSLPVDAYTALGNYNSGWVSASSVTVADKADTWRRNRYLWDTDRANFATGIGSLRHGRVGYVLDLAHLFVTTFDPKIPKDSTEKIKLEVTYSWGRK